MARQLPFSESFLRGERRSYRFALCFTMLLDLCALAGFAFAWYQDDMFFHWFFLVGSLFLLAFSGILLTMPLRGLHSLQTPPPALDAGGDMLRFYYKLHERPVEIPLTLVKSMEVAEGCLWLQPAQDIRGQQPARTPRLVKGFYRGRPLRLPHETCPLAPEDLLAFVQSAQAGTPAPAPALAFTAQNLGWRRALRVYNTAGLVLGGGLLAGIALTPAGSLVRIVAFLAAFALLFIALRWFIGWFDGRYPVHIECSSQALHICLVAQRARTVRYRDIAVPYIGLHSVAFGEKGITLFGGEQYFRQGQLSLRFTFAPGDRAALQARLAAAGVRIKTPSETGKEG